MKWLEKPVCLSVVLFTHVFGSADRQRNDSDLQFDVRLCDTRTTAAQNVTYGRVAQRHDYDSSYVGCRCEVCDAGRENEHHYSFRAERLLFSANHQSLHYAYLYGNRLINVSWENNSLETTLDVSLYSSCVNFTLVLNAEPADVVIRMDARYNRDELLVRCSGWGPTTIRDTDSGSQANGGRDGEDKTPTNAGVIVGIVLFILLVCVTVGVSIYCLLRHRQNSPTHLRSRRGSGTVDTNNKLGPGGNAPDLIRSTGFAEPAQAEPHQEPVTNELRTTDRQPTESDGYDNSNYRPEDNIYHTLVDMRTPLPRLPVDQNGGVGPSPHSETEEHYYAAVDVTQKDASLMKVADEYSEID